MISAEEAQLDWIEDLIDQGRYRTVSEFVREAIQEKLERVEQDRIAESVERYCASGHAAEDEDLIAEQAFDRNSPTARRSKRARRASG